MLKGPLQSGTLKTSKNGYFCTFLNTKMFLLACCMTDISKLLKQKTMISMNSKRDTKQKG